MKIHTPLKLTDYRIINSRERNFFRTGESRLDMLLSIEAKTRIFCLLIMIVL